MMLPWFALLLFMVAVELLALYGLAFSGHFPAEFRNPKLKRGIGATAFWATLAAAALAAAITLAMALRMLTWPAIVIGGGAMLLAAPLLLRSFSDTFVNGLAGLATFAVSALAIAIVLWTAGQ